MGLLYTHRRSPYRHWLVWMTGWYFWEPSASVNKYINTMTQYQYFILKFILLFFLFLLAPLGLISFFTISLFSCYTVHDLKKKLS